MRFAVVLLAAAALATAAQARPGERDQLNACKALVATQSSGALDTPDVTRCRQIIKEWTLRDSRMSVDDEGQPMH